MTARVAPQPYTVPRQYPYPSSQNLLNLDCSADLKSYRRDLGPGVQAKCFEKTSDTIRAQLDDHRAFLLRHRRSGQASGLPSPVPRLEVLQSYTVPSNNAAPPQLTVPNDHYHTASQPRPLQILSQPHAPLQAAPAPTASPVRGNIDTYPFGLRQALALGTQYENRKAGHVYEVIVRVASDEMPTTKDVVGVYEDLRDANMKAANVFLFDGYYASSLDEPTYENGDVGDLRCAVYTDGSTGGYTEIYVKRASARRAQGPRRR